MTTTPQLDPDRLDAFVGRFIDDLGTALHVSTVLVGDRLGLYAAMADGTESLMALERSTGVNHNDIRKWLDAWEAQGIVERGAKPPRAMFRLDELGIPPPPARPARTAKGGAR